MVSRKDKGIAAYCFRCHEKGFISAQLSLAERVERLLQAKGADAEARESVELPSPRVRDPQDWPDMARVWLYKAGFSNDDILGLGFYWSPKTQRVVMPVSEDGTVYYWQARGFDPGLPKYLNPRVDRSRLVAKYGKPGDVLILTEDILSAAKIGKVAWAWSLMGTHMPKPVLLEIYKLGVPVLVALDPDKAGREGAALIVKECEMVGVPAVASFMTKDPKLHSTQEIKEWLLNTKATLPS